MGHAQAQTQTGGLAPVDDGLCPSGEGLRTKLANENFDGARPAWAILLWNELGPDAFFPPGATDHTRAMNHVIQALKFDNFGPRDRKMANRFEKFGDALHKYGIKRIRSSDPDSVKRPKFPSKIPARPPAAMVQAAARYVRQTCRYDPDAAKRQNGLSGMALQAERDAEAARMEAKAAAFVESNAEARQCQALAETLERNAMVDPNIADYSRLNTRMWYRFWMIRRNDGDVCSRAPDDLIDAHRRERQRVERGGAVSDFSTVRDGYWVPVRNAEGRVTDVAFSVDPSALRINAPKPFIRPVSPTPGDCRTTEQALIKAAARFGENVVANDARSWLEADGATRCTSIPQSAITWATDHVERFGYVLPEDETVPDTLCADVRRLIDTGDRASRQWVWQFDMEYAHRGFGRPMRKSAYGHSINKKPNRMTLDVCRRVPAHSMTQVRAALRAEAARQAEIERDLAIWRAEVVEQNRQRALLQAMNRPPQTTSQPTPSFSDILNAKMKEWDRAAKSMLSCEARYGTGSCEYRR